MELHQSVRVDHPLEPVWAALTDLSVVAACLPGAALTSVTGAVHHGTLTIRLGSIRAAFDGTAELTEVDPVRRTVSLSAEGGGTQGQVHLLIRGAAVAAGASATEIRLDTTVRMSGRIAQLGHGAAGAVTERLLGQLTANLDRHLSGVGPGPAGDALSTLSLVPALARAALAARLPRLAMTALAGLVVGAAAAGRARR